MIRNSIIITMIIGYLFFTKISVARDPCNDGSPMTLDIMNCLMIDYEKSDKKLNEIYHNIIENLSTTDKKQLKISQIKWIKSKEKCNKYYNEMEYGYEGRFSVVVCQTQKTDGRIQYLTSYQKCYQINSQPSNIKSCLWSKFQKLDSQLNVIYKEAMLKSSHDIQKDLKQSEIEWINEKNQVCNQNTNINNVKPNNIECLIEKTQEQIEILKNNFK